MLPTVVGHIPALEVKVGADHIQDVKQGPGQLRVGKAECRHDLIIALQNGQNIFIGRQESIVRKTSGPGQDRDLLYRAAGNSKRSCQFLRIVESGSGKGRKIDRVGDKGWPHVTLIIEGHRHDPVFPVLGNGQDHFFAFRRSVGRRDEWTIIQKGRIQRIRPPLHLKGGMRLLLCLHSTGSQDEQAKQDGTYAFHKTGFLRVGASSFDLLPSFTGKHDQPSP